jgi:hypothetical protein
VGVDECRKAVQGGQELAGALRKAEQLTHEILLRATDVTGNAPEQVDRDIDGAGT